jgi:uncharacterized protein YcbK (DUF882 family)
MADLRTLDPRLYPYAKWLYDVAKYNSGRFVVTSAYRSPQDQQRLRERWLSGASSIPAAPPCRSLHQYGLAFDLAQLGVNVHTDSYLPLLGALWERVGGVWGGSVDPVHFAVRI